MNVNSLAPSGLKHTVECYDLLRFFLAAAKVITASLTGIWEINQSFLSGLSLLVNNITIF